MNEPKPCGECQACRDNARFEGMTDYGGPSVVFGRCERMDDTMTTLAVLLGQWKSGEIPDEDLAQALIALTQRVRRDA